MTRILGALKATYAFFAGDAILLAAVIATFVLGVLLAHVAHAPNILVAVVFVAIIAGGLLLTLSRELVGRQRTR